jgi:uncharacterized protein GlcG (DUF336 family)
MGNVRRSSSALAFAITLALGLAACGGSSNSGDPTGTAPPPPATNADSGCTGSCVNANSFLAAADVQRVIAQGVAEAAARQRPGVIAVVDRVGNVLGVYRMPGTPTTVRITSNRGVSGGLENLDVPIELAAIAKAITGAYLSSEGNAFSTRTASQIVQEHFNPGEFNAPAGPLFGVQFSQLSCSDLMTRSSGAPGIGPNRSPLGLSADPGGFPLYKGGVPIGGVGFAGGDGTYGLDAAIGDRDLDPDELVATAATFGFAAPLDRRGDRITADGKTFRFSDVDFSDLSVAPGGTPALLPSGFAAVPGYFDGTVRAGTVFGSPASGIRPDTTRYPGRDAFVLVDPSGAERYAPRAGTSGAGALSAEEARVVVDEALGVVNRARAQIRRPLSTPARVSISVVDTNGTVLALARTRDAPVFGLDVSLQKARTAAFFSGSFAAAELQGRIPVQYFAVALTPNAQAPTGAAITVAGNASISDYVTRLRDFLDRPTALGDGAIAFSDRAIGNLARPYYPDGIISPQAGPLSRPFAQWSPFHDGLQLDLVYTSVAFGVVHYLDRLGLALTLQGNPLPSPFPDPPPGSCTGLPRLGNGIQIFPGGVPIYRGNQLVGAIGISGDGIDQDDMTAFLGLHNAAARLGGSNLGNAPREIRADQLVPDNARLRYVQCPQAPFIGSDEQNVCEGK